MTGSSSPSLDQSSFVRPIPSNQRRRKKVIAVGSDGKPLLRRQSSLSEDIGRCAAETYLITRLSFTLLRYLGVGSRWITQLLALACYAMLLMPGFLQVAYHYFFSSQVQRSVVYGDQPRNRYKAWGSLLGKQLAERDILVACIDYRNFPQGTMSDMVKDVSQGISFVCNNIADYGGDPNGIYLMGQSAGAHIYACVLLRQAIKESSQESISWSVSQIKAYFGLSGGIMEGEESFKLFSPEIMVQDQKIQNVIPLLPHNILFHGTEDYSIPADSSKSFVDALKNVGAQAELVLFDGKTHTDIFLQDPLRGGKDELVDFVVSFIHANDPEALAKDAMAPPRRLLVPELLLKIAHDISPF